MSPFMSVGIRIDVVIPLHFLFCFSAFPIFSGPLCGDWKWEWGIGPGATKREGRGGGEVRPGTIIPWRIQRVRAPSSLREVICSSESPVAPVISMRS